MDGRLGPKLAILVLVPLVLATMIIPWARAPITETYALTPIPMRVQESNTPGVDLVLNVSNAAVGSNYAFTWTVTDPAGSAKNHNNQTVASSSSFLISLVYPRDFGTNLNFVGNYTVKVDQSMPSNKPSIATGQFNAGLTDKTTYERTFTVSIKARGYGNNSPVNVNISHGGNPAPGYPLTVTADGTGQVSTSWKIPANVSTGLWTASLSGNPIKPVTDTQAFTVYPTNVTLSQLSLGQGVLEKTLNETLTFSATYLSGVPAQTGSAMIRITEPDGTTSFYTIAQFNTTLGSYYATYRVPLNAQLGAWVASIDPDVFNDGYGDGGPSSSVVRGFTVQAATLTVLVTVPSQTYTVGDVMPVYAKVTTPDGSLFTNGTVTATLTFNGTMVGSSLSLMYVQGQSEWAAGYVVKSSDPSGLWLVTVKGSDVYGDGGQGTISTVVSVPPPQPPPVTNSPQPLDLYYFLVAALALGGGGSGFLVMRRFNSAQRPFDEFYKLIGGELSPATSLMILGEPGSGTTVLGLELVQRELEKGRHCGLLAYDAFPKEIVNNMKGLGWDVSSHLADGSLKILDCYSSLAGNENAPIKDPTDFTEISIQVTSMIDEAKEGPITILLDSITSLFNTAQARTAVNFLRVLSAKVKNARGILILTGARESIPAEAWSNIENTVDGLVEVTVSRAGESVVRTLKVERLAGRKISLVPREFVVVSGKGVLFKKLRIPLKIFSPRRLPAQANPRKL